MNANEIANGVLSALVAITSSCPFVEYWGACLIGGRAMLIRDYSLFIIIIIISHCCDNLSCWLLVGV